MDWNVPKDVWEGWNGLFVSKKKVAARARGDERRVCAYWLRHFARSTLGFRLE